MAPLPPIFLLHHYILPLPPFASPLHSYHVLYIYTHSQSFCTPFLTHEIHPECLILLFFLIFYCLCGFDGCFCMHFCSILFIYYQVSGIRKFDCFLLCRNNKENEYLNSVETHQKCMPKLVCMPICISESDHSDNAN